MRIEKKSTTRENNEALELLMSAGRFALSDVVAKMERDGVGRKVRAEKLPRVPNKRTKPTKAERILAARQAKYHADVAASKTGGREFTKPGSLNYH
ncbi:hypothetical protein [Zhongshania sp.]|uniref:hypothetical protein n=1 Tax=Zhongshania sp. TaxID=1971902 RepID=UPI0035676EBD